MQSRWCFTALLLTPALIWLGAGARMPHPECAPAADCEYIEGYITTRNNSVEFYFNVSGHVVEFKYHYGFDIDFELSCNYMTMDNAMLPRFPMAFPVKRVKFKECALPRNGSFAAAVAALNITGFSQLTLDTFPEPAVITHSHLTGLQRLHELELRGNNNTSLARGALAALSGAPALHKLILNAVRASAADLARLPSSLQELKLWDVRAASLHLDSPFNLMSLDVFDSYYPVVVNASNAAALKELVIDTPSTVLDEDALPSSLTSLLLWGWNDMHPVPKTRCARLEGLLVVGTDNESYPLSLPDEWLSNCGQLKELEVRSLPVRGVVPARLLANATALQMISIRSCNLTALPPGLFDDTLNLIKLDLSYNKLTSLPSGLFKQTKLLKSLSLSNNQLTSEVAWTLSTVTSLNVLSLHNNYRIGDLCSRDSVSGPSPLSSLTELRLLYLSHTGVSRVCSDWREKLTKLISLDLTENPITLYNFADLQFKRTQEDDSVYLGHFKQQFTRTDYVLALNDDTKAAVTIFGSLECDCTSYWAAQVFHTKAWRSSNLTICGGKPVTAVDPDTLTCPTPEQCATLADSCTCRIHDDIRYKQVVTVQCSRLTEFPRLPPTSHKWILHLPNNNMSYLAAADVSPNIVELDLRNNSIKKIDVETSAKLASVRLQLAGNPLECDCEALKMLAPLLDPNSKLIDREEVKCENGAQITLAMLKLCPKLSNGLVYLLFVLLLVAFVVAGLLARSAMRLHIKMMLMRLGWMPRLLEPTDDDRPYDVFVSFAHEDQELVIDQLAARLESGSRPYRLCLHYRDWTPGEWIPAQIAASVRASRRTVAVVSAHYLQSSWARAEFREATAASLQDGTPRLVVVLLDEPDRLTLDVDPELRAYVRKNTYVRWRDPWFWEKLKQALPPPRERRTQVVPLLLALAPSHDTLALRTCSPRECDPVRAATPARSSRETHEPSPSASPCSS